MQALRAKPMFQSKIRQSNHLKIVTLTRAEADAINMLIADQEARIAALEYENTCLSLLGRKGRSYGR